MTRIAPTAVCPGLDARALADHLEDAHHRTTWDELARLAALADQLPEREPVVVAFRMLQERFEEHLRREERVLFPMVRDLAADEPRPSFHCGGLQSAIQVLLREHEGIEEAFDLVALCTDGYRVPPGADLASRAFVAGLADFDADTRIHLGTEADVLFPEVLRLEQRRREVAVSHWSG